MLNGLKSYIIKKTLEKKKQKNTLDYKSLEVHEIDTSTDPVLNNSYSFFACGDNGEAILCRLSVRSARKEIFFVYINNENKYLHNSTALNADSPLRIEKHGVEWRVRFNGEVEGESGEKTSLLLDGYFASDCRTVDFFSDMPTEKIAKDLANDGWSRRRLSKIRESKGTHSEQPGKLFGRVTLGRSEFAVDMPCVREYTFGEFKTESLNNHFRLVALKGKSQLSFLMISSERLTALELGDFISDERKMLCVTGASYDRALISKGSAPTDMSLTLRLEDGTSLPLSLEKMYECEHAFSDGEYTLYECLADFEIGGERYFGFMELGFNREPTRWFNGRRIKDCRH